MSRGAVGLGLVDRAGAYLPAAEAVLRAGEDWQPVTLRAAREAVAGLRIRNMHAGRRGTLAVRLARLRAT